METVWNYLIKIKIHPSDGSAVQLVVVDTTEIRVHIFAYTSNVLHQPRHVQLITAALSMEDNNGKQSKFTINKTQYHFIQQCD